MANRVVGRFGMGADEPHSGMNRQARRAESSRAKRGRLFVPDGMGGFAAAENLVEQQHVSRPAWEVCQEILGKIANLFGEPGVGPMNDALQAEVVRTAETPLTRFEELAVEGVGVLHEIQQLARCHLLEFTEETQRLIDEAAGKIDDAEPSAEG